MMDYYKKGDIVDGQYEIVKKKGFGGFGDVYEVVEIKTQEKFALKICTETDQNSRDRFNREIRLMEDSEHDNVVKILAHNPSYEPPYFVMPLAKCSFEEEADELRPDDIKILRLFLKACEGVKYLHDSGKYHRDIKPGNMLIFDDGSICVSDLGLGVSIDRKSTILTGSSWVIGTNGYIPPEFFTDGTKYADQRSDIFQLGKTLYRLLSGESPQFFNMKKVAKGLNFIIAKSIRHNPDDRYQSVSEMIEDIKTYLSSKDPDSNPEIVFDGIEKRVAGNSDDKAYFDKIMHAFSIISIDHGKYKKYFEKIPLDVLITWSNQYPNDVLDICSEYYESLEHYFNTQQSLFEEADKISDDFTRLYNECRSIDIKIQALKIILLAAFNHNRFYAMDRFWEIISNVEDDAEAMAVVDFLSSEKDKVNRINKGPSPKDVKNFIIQKHLESQG